MGSVIVTSRAPVGNVAVALVPLATNQGCKALIPQPERITSDYLELVAQLSAATMQSLATGTTFQEISGARLGSMLIHVPSLCAQRSIVEELSRASEGVSAHLPWVQVDGWLGQRAVDVTPAAAIQGLGDPAP